MPGKPSAIPPRPAESHSYHRSGSIQKILEDCTDCGACTVHCEFLKSRGTPGQLARVYAKNPDVCLPAAFECSLCGLCTAFCPGHLDISAMFLSWRQEAVAKGLADLAPYRGLLAYEKKGCSPLFSYYHLPSGCDTVFFPGCTLTGTRPSRTLAAFEYLSALIPGAGIVLDCCTKPSYNLGRRDFAEAMVSEMCGYLAARSVTTVVTACPSCHRMFSRIESLNAVSLYQIMAEDRRPGGLPCFDRPRKGRTTHRVIVQDPCQARDDPAGQAAVRAVARRAGLTVDDTRFSGKKTVCCGEGGAVGCIRPDLAKAWTDKNARADAGSVSLTYCAGCVNYLSGRCRSLHVIDLAFAPEAALDGRIRTARAPFTYLHRLRVKRKLKSMGPAETRERTFFHGKRNPLGPGWLAALIRGFRSLSYRR